MATARFELNRGFEAELLRDVHVAHLLDALAEEGAEVYRDGVPVAEGDLRDSVFGDVALTERGWIGRIGAEDWKAGIIEFGTSLRAPDGSLRRAIESLGLTIVYDRGGDT